VLTLLQRNSSVLQVPKSPRNTDESRARWRDEGKRLVRAFGAQHVNLEALEQRPRRRRNQALAMIDAESIDVAVLDVNLRGQMSYPIADVLVARGVPFVFSTGYDKDRLLDGYRTFPALQKPFHRSDLGDTLAKLLASKERNVESAIATVVDD
jgi:DNA-binding NtrC family response regulator